MEVCNKLFGVQRRAKGRQLEVYWWNKDIADAKAACNKSRRVLTRARASRNTNKEQQQESSEQQYRECKKKLRNLIRRAKKAAWSKLLEDMNNYIWGDAYKIVCKRLKTFPRLKLGNEEAEKIIRDLFPEAPEIAWPGASKNKKKGHIRR